MKIDVDKIKEKLTTTILGKNIVYIEEIPSTQDTAKEEVDKLVDGTYVITDKQTKGKGTHGRIWYDRGYENICGTFILKPNCNISKLENLTVVIAECMVEAIKRAYGIELEIKYPNDLMYNSKKIAGILTESVTNNEIVKYIFVGIGININQTVFDDDIKDIATSLKKEFNKEFERETIIAEFFNIFEKEYLKLIK